MIQSKVLISTVCGLALLVTACGSGEQTPNISEDQMNHYAGVSEHDHPTNSSTDATIPPATSDVAVKQ